MLSIEVPQCYMITKNYDINITKFKGTIYEGDTNWIAEWFYTQYEPFADNVLFHSKLNYGDFYIEKDGSFKIKVLDPHKVDEIFGHDHSEKLNFKI